MMILYFSIFAFSVMFSAFFSSAETSLLSLNEIKLNLRARKKDKKAQLLVNILGNPETFFSTILIGNNFVNIMAASISTAIFTQILDMNEQVELLISSVVTTTIILLFSEILPKSYAFRYSEKIAYTFAYPIQFFTYLFYPFVKVTSGLSNLIFKTSPDTLEHKELTIEEVKHFLHSQRRLFHYNPESLRMLNEIIDTADKDIKSIMTPRLNIIALNEGFTLDQMKEVILNKKITKIPVFKDNLDHITGIIHTDDVLFQLLGGDSQQLDIEKIVRKPIFLSEYSSINYAFRQFKKHGLTIAVILDEYGSTIGIVTLNDIFKEILGEIRSGRRPIREVKKNVYIVKGSTPVEEVKHTIHVDFPEKVDYTTISGLFIYHYGKLPRENNFIHLKNVRMTVRRMGRRKIEELLLVVE